MALLSVSSRLANWSHVCGREQIMFYFKCDQLPYEAADCMQRLKDVVTGYFRVYYMAKHLWARITCAF